MLRNEPRLAYKGLTIVLSNPSRFDNTNLLSANGGCLLNESCLRPDMNTMQCDIRLADDKTPLLPDTKCILLLGEYAMHSWLPESRRNTLNELRGTVFQHNSIPVICSYFPQDAADMRGHEQTLNPLSKDFVEDGQEDGDDDDDFEDAKKHGKTKRSNYAFWLKADVTKVKHILKNGVPKREEPIYKSYTNSSEIIEVLLNNKGGWFYFDMETDYEEQNMQCFSFSFDGKVVYNVPVLDYNYRPAYSSLAHILHALCIALRDNITVAHNGACFDFFVLASKYKIAVRQCYDTMIAMHRCFPDIEKSLGHCTSFWTWEAFHKDEDSTGYMTQQQMAARMKYCGKDVYTMFLIHKAIEQHVSKIPGLQHSIDTANSHIVPYLTTTLQGIKYDKDKVIVVQKENDKLMNQYLRIINTLIGESGLIEVRKCVKGRRAGAFPSSNTQCCEYFHNLLGYPVVARGPDSGKPSLGKKALYKLALKETNPVITFSLLFRTVKKEYSTLKFLPWKDDNDLTVNPKTYDSMLASATNPVQTLQITN